jgi:dTDP-4-dehydrorhamnose reductase
MLSVGRGREEMRVVRDQRGGPTWAGDIAAALWTIADAWAAGEGRAGVFHYAGAPAVSWAEFAEAIFARSGWSAPPKVVAIASREWPTRAARPANSVLDCAAVAEAYGLARPDWRPALDGVVAELEGAE